MRLFLALLLSISPNFGPMQEVTGHFNKGPSGGSSGSYTGSNCSNGTSVSSNSIACSATMSVSTGDIVVAFGTMGDQSVTLSSCSTATGTATVSWTVDTAASNTIDASNNEVEGMCHGNVTNGGTVEPQMTYAGTGTASDQSIVAIGFSGLKNTTDGGVAADQGSPPTTSNGVTPGNITTTVNGDTLIGGIADTSGSAATITAGTTSVTFTKIVCNTGWGGQTCIEWGNQTTAGASTTAAWTISVSDRTLSAVLAVEHN